MKLKVLKLGTECTDHATGTVGTLTHWICNLSKSPVYIFQPKGLNPKTGLPVPMINMESERLEVQDEDWEEIDFPIEILGTEVTDKPSGFTGSAVGFIRDINGCFHVYIQPSKVLKETNSLVDRQDFDLRQCTGPAIKKMTDEEKDKSKKYTPSPAGGDFSNIHSVSDQSISGSFDTKY